MRYLTTIPLKLKTPDGILDLQPGDTFRPDSPDAVKSLLAEGKLKPFCYWLKSVVDDCLMPCFEIEAKVVNYECPHFKTYWAKRLSELQNTGSNGLYGRMVNPLDNQASKGLVESSRELQGIREKKYLKTIEVIE